MDFARRTAPAGKLAVVVSAPLTAGEDWRRMQPGELRVFTDGQAA